MSAIVPPLGYAFIRTESGFDPAATSSVEARGLMQMTEETFIWLRSKIAPDEGLTFDELYDPDVSIPRCRPAPPVCAAVGTAFSSAASLPDESVTKPVCCLRQRLTGGGVGQDVVCLGGQHSLWRLGVEAAGGHLRRDAVPGRDALHADFKRCRDHAGKLRSTR